MKRIGLPVLILPVLVLLAACKQKKKKEPFFPVLSFIKSQVAHVDTSFYPIRKITFTDSTRADTVYYKREQFGELAADFLNLPDISDQKFQGRFTEQSRLDVSINRVILTYLPVNPDKEELQRQEVLIQPDPSGDKTKNIIIDYFSSKRDSLIEKRMLWRVDHSFQVVTTRQLPGRPDTTIKFKVIWNEDEQE